MKKNFPLLIIILIFVQACQRNTEKFNGTWQGTKIDSSYATLKINNDKNTFSYKTGGSGVTTFSNGHFKVVGDSIILTSTNATEIDSCYYILEFGNCTFNEPRLTQLNCIASKSKFYDFFDNDAFYIKDHFLIYKSKLSDNCPNQPLTQFKKQE